MTETTPIGRASQVILDGPVRRIPGAAALRGDTPLIIIPSGLLDLVNAVAHQAAFYFPFDATILSIKGKIRAAPGTGPGIAKVGTVADDDKFAAFTVTTDTNVHDTGTEVTFTILNSGTINAGDVLTFSGDGGATSTGGIDITVVAVPR